MKSKFFKKDIEECDVCKEINVEHYEDGGGVNQLPYTPASQTCVGLDTVVPASMAGSLAKFNNAFRAAMIAQGTSVEEWVAKKLKYKSVEDMCFWYNPDSNSMEVRLSNEQVDSIGTAIYNSESTGDAIIIADQTGIGKGRQAAGLIRYAILTLGKKPYFITEKKHLIHDIYRDLFAVGLDAGVPVRRRVVNKIEVDESILTDDYILELIKKDFKVSEGEDLKVDFEIPEEAVEEGVELKHVVNGVKDTDKNYDLVEQLQSELIELYYDYLVQEGKYEEVSYEDVPEAEYSRLLKKAMSEGRRIVKPLLPGEIDVKNKYGDLIYLKQDKKRADDIYKNKEKGDQAEFSFPQECDLVAFAYSQLSAAYSTDKNTGKRTMKNKIRFLMKFANDNVIILDEAHKAAGRSGVFQLCVNMVRSASMVTYLSATFAKEASNMPIYSVRTCIREAGLSDEEMVDTFRVGGNALQEAVSSELSKNGQLLRREKKIFGSKEPLYLRIDPLSELGASQIARLNMVALAFEKIRRLDGKVREKVRRLNRDIDKPNNAIETELKPSRGIGAYSFQLFNFMLLGLKCDNVIAQALERLNNGEKPIITLANTMEAALSNMPKSFDAPSKDENNRYKVGEDIKNDFSLYLQYLAYISMSFSYSGPHTAVVDSETGEATVTKVSYNVFDKIPETNAEAKIVQDELRATCLEEYSVLQRELVILKTGIPIAPIDIIKEGITSQGFKIEEITGRSKCVKIKKDASQEFVTISQRKKQAADVFISMYNKNETDCLIINQSGAVGVSAHAIKHGDVNIVYEIEKPDGTKVGNPPTSLENPKEVKKRVMIVTQMELDVTKEVQKLGRINRTGQVYEPEYVYIISAIPSEARLSAMMEKKLRSLSSITAGDQEQSSHLYKSEDYFSDTAIQPFNDTVKFMRLPVGTITTKTQIEQFVKSLYFTDYGTQKLFFDTFSEKLQLYVQKLIEEGNYTGKMTMKDYKAESIYTYPLFIGNENSRTTFGGHSFIEKANVKVIKPKNLEAKITPELLSNLVLENSPSRVAAEGKQRFFLDEKEYIEEAVKRIREFEQSRVEVIQSDISASEGSIQMYKNDIANAEEKLKEYARLGEAEELKAKLTLAEEAIKEKSKELTEYIMSGNAEPLKLAEFTNEVAKLKKEVEDLKVQYEPLEKLVLNKFVVKSCEQTISDANKGIERGEYRLKRYEEDMREWLALIEKSIKYVQSIGSVFLVTENKEEKEDIENEDGDFSTTYTYELENSHASVLVGVAFPDNASSFIPSEIKLKFINISTTNTIPLSKMKDNFSEEEIASGRKPKAVLDLISGHYKNYWDKEIAAKIDSSELQNRFIISGSILKAYNVSSTNNIKGSIIQYSTKDNKTRIGIEINNNENSQTDQNNSANRNIRTTYKILSELYDKENPLYPVYFNANQSNVDKFVLQFAYDETIGKLEEYSIQNTDRDDIYDLGNRIRSIGKDGILFQMTTKRYYCYIKFKINADLIEEISAIIEKIRDGGSFDKPALIDFARKSTIELVFVDDVSRGYSIMASNTFATLLRDYADWESSSESHRYVDEKFVSPEFRSYEKKFDAGYGGLFVQYRLESILDTAFPSDLEKMRASAYKTIRAHAWIKCSYQQFDRLVSELESLNALPVLSTSSKYFEKHRSSFNLQRTSEDIKLDIKAGGDVVFVDEKASAAMDEINLIIDELIELLID